MKYIVTFMLLWLAALSVLAQPSSDPKFKQKFNKADALVYEGSYSQAVPLLEEMYAADSANANLNYLLGVSLMMGKNDYVTAIRLLENATRDVSLQYNEANWKERKAPGITYYYLGQAYHYKNDFEKAINNYYNYRSFVEMDDVATYNKVRQQIQYAENAMEMIKNPVGVKITNMGAGINTKYADYCPVVSADGKVLIFTSRREGGVSDVKDADGNYFDDIYICHRQPNGTWSKPVGIGPTINTAGHEAAIGLSPNGQLLFIYKDDNGNGNIYYSEKKGDGWSSPLPMGSDINTASWETHASINATEDLLVFVSNRAGGFGGRDLWFCKRLPNGEWGLAQNMGSVINSRYEEDSPFISADGKTLIFSSQGHTSMGGFDIFRSEFVDGAWSIPQNIGYPISTSEDDVFFVLTPDGRQAYYSSRRDGGYGDADIYKLRLEIQTVSSSAVARGSMKVPAMDYTDVRARIVVSDEQGTQLGTYRPNKSTGYYVLVLPPGNTYQISYQADGYDAVTKRLSVSDQQVYEEFNGVITLDEVVFGENILALQQETQRLEKEKAEAAAKLLAEEKLAAEADLLAMKEAEQQALRQKEEDQIKKAEAQAKAEKEQAAKELAAEQEKARLAEEERKKSEAQAKYLAEQEIAAKQQAEEKARAEKELAEKTAAEAKFKEEQELKEKAAKAEAEMAEQKAAEQKAAEQKAKEERAAEMLAAKQAAEEREQLAIQKQQEEAKQQAELKAKEEQELAVAKQKEIQEAQAAEEARMLQEKEAAQKADEERAAIALAKAKEQSEEETKANAEVKAETENRPTEEPTSNEEASAENAVNLNAEAIQAKREAMIQRIEELKKQRAEMQKNAAQEVEVVAEASETEAPATDEDQELQSDAQAKKIEMAQAEQELEMIRVKEEEVQAKIEKEAAEKLAAEEALRVKKKEDERLAAEEAKKLAEAEEAARQLKEIEKQEQERLAAEKLAAEQLAKEQRAEAEKAKMELIQMEAIADQQRQVAAAMETEERKKAAIAAAEKSAFTDEQRLANAATLEELKELNMKLIADNLELRKQLVELNSKLDLILARLEYQPDKEKVDMASSSTMRSLQEGKQLILRNIYFDYNLASLRPNSKYELNRLFNFMKDNPEVSIVVSGHTDSRGNADYNMRLSKERAAAVVNYLVSIGISANRLAAKGYGATRPIARNENADHTDNPTGRQLNRRIEISLLHGKGKGVEMEEVEIPKEAQIK